MGRKQFLRPVFSPVPMAVAVTGHVDIPDHPRSREDYETLGLRLGKTDIPLMFMEDNLDECWLYRHIKDTGKEVTHSISDNPAKNTLAYHCVQAQKTEWLVRALDALPIFGMPDVMVWVDLGIFSLPGMSEEIIVDFMHRAAFECSIAIPGCWSRDYHYNDQHPCWRFCGGVLVMPRVHAVRFDSEMKKEYKRWLTLTGNVSWEVNTMARLESNMPRLPIRHYYADHNQTLFTNY